MTMDRVNAILANEEYKDWMEHIMKADGEASERISGHILQGDR